MLEAKIWAEKVKKNLACYGESAPGLATWNLEALHEAIQIIESQEKEIERLTAIEEQCRGYSRWCNICGKVFDDYVGDEENKKLKEEIDRLKEFEAELLEACEEAYHNSVDAQTYPDGPCLDTEIRVMLKKCLWKKAGEFK